MYELLYRRQVIDICQAKAAEVVGQLVGNDLTLGLAWTRQPSFVYT